MYFYALSLKSRNHNLAFQAKSWGSAIYFLNDYFSEPYNVFLTTDGCYANYEKCSCCETTQVKKFEKTLSKKIIDMPLSEAEKMLSKGSFIG